MADNGLETGKLAQVFPNAAFVPFCKGRNHEKRREKAYNLGFILILIYFEKYHYR